MTTGTNWMRKDEHIANADFIAAVNPAVVLDLIDRVSRLSLPVEAREVTDAEILAIAVESAKRYQSVSAVTDQGAIEFARAILAGRTT